MRRETRPAVLVLVVTLVLTLVLVVSPVLAASFSDITSDTYDNPDYPEAVSTLSDLGIVSGFNDGTYRPHDPVTRQQFAKMIVKLSGYPVTGAEACPFTDVSETPTSADPLYPASYVAVCAGLGIAKGVDATHFAPYKNITRAQSITMLIRMAQQIGVPLQAPTEAYYAGLVPNSLFHNVDDPVHGSNIQLAEMNNLLWGLWPDIGNRWDIYAKATRGEVAHIMYRLWQRMNGATTTTTTEPSTTTTTRPTTTTLPATTTTSSTTTSSSTTTTVAASTTTTVAAGTATTLSGSKLLYSDDFSNETSGWPVGLSDWVSAQYQNGAYVMECQGATGGWRTPGWEIADARILADLTLSEGQDSDSCGIIFRERNGERYEFAINAKGYYALWYRTTLDVSILVNWTYSEALKPVGTTNHLKIVLSGTEFSFTVNDIRLLTIEDAALDSGTIGLTVNSGSIYPVKAKFDNIEVWSH
jgi:hypothetical protein